MDSYLFKYGQKIILFCILLIILGKILNMNKLIFIGVLFFCFSYYFFRIIKFNLPVPDKNTVYAPSYGKIISINKINKNGTEYIHIATFISLFDPHIQYAPIHGHLTAMNYHRGTFYPAMFFSKTENNERMTYHIDTIHGRITFSQIAGMIAQTIVPFVKPNTILNPGQEIGLIKFGSRCDIFIPYKSNLYISVKVGDKLVGGQSMIAKYF